MFAKSSLQRHLALTDVMLVGPALCAPLPLAKDDWEWGGVGGSSTYMPRCRNHSIAAMRVIKPRSNDHGWRPCSKAGMPEYWHGRSLHSRCLSTSHFLLSRAYLQVIS